MMLDIQMTIRSDWGCRHLSSPYYYQDHIFTPTMRIQLLADFSRATARAHSTLRCIASPHGPLRVAYSIFRLPRASCSHLVLSIRLSLPRFSLYLCLPTSARHSRLLSACPFPFSKERALNPYPNISFKYMSLFHHFLYIINALLSSFILSTDRPSRGIKRDEPKGSPTLGYISDPLIVHTYCAVLLKDSILYYTLLVTTRSTKVCSLPHSPCSTPSQPRFIALPHSFKLMH